jgi:hypothetical protein
LRLTGRCGDPETQDVALVEARKIAPLDQGLLQRVVPFGRRGALPLGRASLSCWAAASSSR